jgi:hypothetical protein
VADIGVTRDSSLSVGQLRQLRALPRLTALNVIVDGADLENQIHSPGDSREQCAQLVRDSLPSQLCSLTLGCDGAVSARQALIDALPMLADLHTLHLNMTADDLNLAPLLHLPRLSRLDLYRPPSLVQCTVVKRLAELTALEANLRFWNRAALLQLLEPPHSLQRLRDLELGPCETVDPPLLAALLTLPALTEMQPAYVAPECWAALSHLGQLRSLHVGWGESFTAAQQSALESALRALPQLTRLCIDLERDAQFDGPPLDLRLPGLISAELRHLRLLSLDFLRHSPLLTELDLDECRQMGADDALRCLQSFAPQLRRLSLLGCLDLSAEQHSALRPPSALLPALVEFSFQSL